MIQKRPSIFETNSSSVHAICISRKPYVLPKSVHFALGNYGWENAYPNPADYLYTALVDMGYDHHIDSLKETLASHGVSCTFEEVGDDSWHYGIDHAGDLHTLIFDLFSDDDRLLRYLFSPATFIHTGNDNGGNCPMEAEPQIYDWGKDCFTPNPDHDPDNFEYYEKGN